MLITDYKEWTAILDLEDFEEVDSLYQSVKNVSDYGLFRTVKGRQDGTYVVAASYVDDRLFLASEDIRSAFLRFIKDKYCGGEMEEAWYGVMRANAKED